MSEKTKKFKLQSIDTFSTLILSAFSLVAALAWNEAIKSLIGQFLSAGDDWIGMVIYAIIVTILAVIVILAMNAQVAKLKAGLEDDE